MTDESGLLLVAAVRQELSHYLSRDGGTRVLLTGIGRERALRAVRKALAARSCRMVISTGFAGGTCSGLRVGDLVIASEVIEADSGRRWNPRLPNGDWNRLASIGPFVTADRAVQDSAQKSDMGQRYRAIAVDLETAAVAQAAEEARVPWLAIRAILDPMEQPLPVGSLRQALILAATPSRWRDFRDFLKNVRSAGRSLAAGLEALVSRM